MKIYRYKFNSLKCSEIVIKDNRGALYYPSDFDGIEYFSVRGDDDVQHGHMRTINLKNSWFDIEEIEINGFDEAIDEEVERRVEEINKE